MKSSQKKNPLKYSGLEIDAIIISTEKANKVIILSTQKLGSPSLSVTKTRISSPNSAKRVMTVIILENMVPSKISKVFT